MMELECIRADLIDGPSNDSNWVVIRQDHPKFAALAARWPDAVRPVRDMTCYGRGANAYDFNGPDGENDPLELVANAEYGYGYAAALRDIGRELASGNLIIDGMMARTASGRGFPLADLSSALHHMDVLRSESRAYHGQ